MAQTKQKVFFSDVMKLKVNGYHTSKIKLP